MTTPLLKRARWLRPVWAFIAGSAAALLFCLVPGTARANGDERRLTVDGRLGYAWLLHARSGALEHKFKPALRLSLLTAVASRLELGGALSGLLETDSNYGVWAAYGIGRYAFVRSRFELAGVLGLGIGHNAPILYDDLTAQAAIVPYASLALQASWRLSDPVWLGIELGNEQLSIVHLGALARIEL